MPGSYERRIARVIAHIKDHPDEDLSLDRLAEIAAMSRFHWHRVFRAMTGETLADAVRRIRMQQAAALVAQGEPVADIARRVGYQTTRSFARAFAQVHGLSPSAFRDRGCPVPADTTHLHRTGATMTHEIATRREPARRLFAMPHRGPYTEIGQAFARLGDRVGPSGLWPSVQGMFALYYDDPGSVAPADLRSHAAFALPEDAVRPDGVEELRLPGGLHAVLRHRGPYSGLAAAWDHLYGTWLPQAGHEIADSPPYEFYLNSPQDTAPAALLTDICVPLRE
jgi:AraC family transcriptional regulator